MEEWELEGIIMSSEEMFQMRAKWATKSLMIYQALQEIAGN